MVFVFIISIDILTELHGGGICRLKSKPILVLKPFADFFASLFKKRFVNLLILILKYFFYINLDI